ncbi:MAG: hypothetical protein FWE31_05840 [Firmicutes bacterium]|nr:hypothetical protein [Bacillota bacterium]
MNYEVVNLNESEATGILEVRKKKMPIFQDRLFKLAQGDSPFRAINDVMSSLIVKSIGNEAVDVKLAVLNQRGEKKLGRLSEGVAMRGGIEALVEPGDLSPFCHMELEYLPSPSKWKEGDFGMKRHLQFINIKQALESLEFNVDSGGRYRLSHDYEEKFLRRYLSLITTMDFDTLWTHNNGQIVKKGKTDRARLTINPGPFYDGEFMMHGFSKPLYIPEKNFDFLAKDYSHILEGFADGLGVLEGNLEKIFDPGEVHLFANISQQEMQERFDDKRRGVERQIVLLRDQMGVS